MKKKKQRLILLFVLAGLVIAAAMVFLFSVLFFKVDLSQSYRKIDGVNQIVFKDWQGLLYHRCFWGLERMENREISEMKEETIYTTAPSGQFIAYYDLGEHRIVLCDSLGVEITYFPVDYYVGQIVFSPDERYLLYQEIQVYGGFSTDEEYCYYRVADIETKDVVTIYKGYREWYQLAWQAD